VVSLHDRHWPSEARTGASWFRQVGPPDLTPVRSPVRPLEYAMAG
jgi:hypothetical protein